MKKLATLLLALLLFTTTVYASSTIQAILSKDIKVKIEGNDLDMRDANGNPVFPIIYNGTTYLPVRTVAEKLGLKVDWDGKTKTVNLKIDYEEPKQKESYGLNEWWMVDGNWKLKINSVKVKKHEIKKEDNFKEIISINYSFENLGVEDGVFFEPYKVIDSEQKLARGIQFPFIQKYHQKAPIGTISESGEVFFEIYSANSKTVTIIFDYLDENNNRIEVPFIVPIER